MLHMTHLLRLEDKIPWSLAGETCPRPLHGWQRVKSKEGGPETLRTASGVVPHWHCWLPQFMPL